MKRLLAAAGVALFLSTIFTGTASATTLSAGDSVVLTSFDNYDFVLDSTVSSISLELDSASTTGVVSFAVVDGFFKALNALDAGDIATFTVAPTDTDLNFTVAPIGLGSFALTVTAVPIPAAAWLFGSAILGLTLVARRQSGDVARAA